VLNQHVVMLFVVNQMLAARFAPTASIAKCHLATAVTLKPTLLLKMAKLVLWGLNAATVNSVNVVIMMTAKIAALVAMAFVNQKANYIFAKKVLM